VTDVRPRAVIEAEIALANDEIEIAHDDLARAQEHIAVLEAELAALPPEGADEELWYARRDARQLGLFS
jgi:hypothetical protein